MEYHLLSDELLVRLLRVDDASAFNEIYKRHWKRLYQSAQHKIASQDVLEEILQNVFLKIWEKRDSQHIEDLGAYLYSAIKYQIMDHYRAQFMSEKYQNQIMADKHTYDDSTEQTIHMREIASIFDAVLSSLPEKTSRVFHLSRQEMKTTREISKLLAIPERTVEYHITLSLKQLRKSLKDFLPSLLVIIDLFI